MKFHLGMLKVTICGVIICSVNNVTFLSFHQNEIDVKNRNGICCSHVCMQIVFTTIIDFLDTSSLPLISACHYVLCFHMYLHLYVIAQ